MTATLTSRAGTLAPAAALIGVTAVWGSTFVVIKDGEEHSTFLGETTYDQLAHLIRRALDAS